jgi:SAM-dependent methyltransferase
MEAAEIRDVNTRYHDVAAAGYDAKWGIGFGDVGEAQVLAKVGKVLDSGVARSGFERALEIGAGTGYFGLNLLQAGFVKQLTCVDISPGMLAALTANAADLELSVDTAVADAESLPFAEQSFDLVLGHAVLHHIPDLDQAFREMYRVLRPGGQIVFAGEPSRVGDRLARVPKRAAALAAPGWRRLLRAGPRANGDTHSHTDAHPHAHDHDLELFVDVHAFAPPDLSDAAASAGFTEIRIRGEELTANWFGWFNRGLEASANPDDVPMLWRRYAFHGFLALQKLDTALFEPRLPAAVFYNLLLSARRP